MVIDNPHVFYSLGGALKSQTVLQSVAGSEQKSVNTALALPGSWVTYGGVYILETFRLAELPGTDSS